MKKIKIINKSKNSLPKYETLFSAGMDLKADLEHFYCEKTEKDIPLPIILKPFERALVKTNLFIQLPEGYEGQIRPRSGLAIKKGIIANFGTIDSDYRGGLGVILFNLSNETFIVNQGDRIAQFVVAKHEKVEWLPVEVLDETERGTGGFGSTKLK